MRRFVLPGLLPLLAIAWPAPATADWHFAPFFGFAFGGQTTFVDPGGAIESRGRAFGGTVQRLGQGPLGLEVDFGHSRRTDEGPLAGRNLVTTLMGNIVVAAPLKWTGYSLRPYVSGGLGLMRVRNDDAFTVFLVATNLLGFNVGGGAAGFLSDHVGLRWDLRYLRNVTGTQEPGVTFGDAHLSFWRGSMAVVLRY